METKTLALWSFLGSLVLSVVGWVLTNAYLLGFCYADFSANTFDVSCNQNFYGIGSPLLYGGGALAIVSLVLIFVPKAWEAWKKFAIWFLPLATLLFIFYPEPGSGDLFSPYPETVYKWVSGAYILISAVIIGAVVGKKK